MHIQGGPQKWGQRVSLQIFWKLHDRIAWKYCEYLLAYLLIIVSFDDVTFDVIVLFIFGLILPETLCVTCSVTMLLSLSQLCGHQTIRTWIRWITLFGGAALQQLVYQHQSFTSVAELKQAIINAWQELSQSFIDRSTNEWRRRLECVVHQNGGHIEHLFK